MSGPRSDTWMPWYIGDYLADTMHLTRDQHGGYLLLIGAYWRRGGPLPDNDGHLAGITRASPVEWRKLRPVLAEFFEVIDGLWKHKRIDEERTRAETNTGKRAKAGATGAANRWHKDSNAHGKPIAMPLANASQNDGPSPLPSEDKKERTPNGVPKKSRAKPKTTIPVGWDPGDDGREFARARGKSEAKIDVMAETFCAHHTSKGSVFSDWPAAWRTWVLNDSKFDPKGDRSANDEFSFDAPYDAERGKRVLAEVERELREMGVDY